jgi:uncharacterized protein (DUF1800 family)
MRLAPTRLFAACLSLFAVTSARAAEAPVSPRAAAQHLLRRFSFSASPSEVTALLNSSREAWLATQENPDGINDDGSELETLPTQLVNGGYPDWNIFERAVVQHMILTRRQLQAKMELHWLDHFSVSIDKVGDPAIMYHYNMTVRANALGNFATLLAAVANEPAMLIWLDNNWNVGPVANENFGRESMQLYSTGTSMLNPDGSLKLGKNGQPIPAYSQMDVRQIALAMTGYGVVIDPNNNDPQTRFSVQYYPGNHYNGTLKFFGQVQNVPTDGTAITYVMNLLAHRPSTAAFEVTELLQRFVTETPSPQFIADIEKVWHRTEDAPDQISQVITAIVNHPEFDQAYRGMLKQPVEEVFQSLRQMPGMMQETADVKPGASLLWELNELGQELWEPVSVFSFYRPGQLASTVNTGTVLGRTGIFANITSADPTNPDTDTYIDMPTLRAAIGSTDGGAITKYLLDALLDGGSPQQEQVLRHYLGAQPSDNMIRSGIWLLLNAPDYAAN